MNELEVMVQFLTVESEIEEINEDLYFCDNLALECEYYTTLHSHERTLLWLKSLLK